MSSTPRCRRHTLARTPRRHRSWELRRLPCPRHPPLICHLHLLCSLPRRQRRQGRRFLCSSFLLSQPRFTRPQTCHPPYDPVFLTVSRRFSRAPARLPVSEYASILLSPSHPSVLIPIHVGTGYHHDPPCYKAPECRRLTRDV